MASRNRGAKPAQGASVRSGYVPSALTISISPRMVARWFAKRHLRGLNRRPGRPIPPRSWSDADDEPSVIAHRLRLERLAGVADAAEPAAGR